jgi:hypothetical protein
MPTILSVAGLRVVIYPNDHRPSHVHVMGRGNEAVFNLQCPHGPPVLRENFGFSRAELSRVAASLAAALAELCHRWRLLHGDF